MSRRLIAVVLLLVVAAGAAWLGWSWRRTPGQGMALVVRSGEQVEVSDRARLVLPGRLVCELPLGADGVLRHELEVEPVDLQGASWPLHVVFEANPPTQLSSSWWPEGTYCESVAALVAGAAETWVRAQPAEALRELRPADIEATWRGELEGFGYAVASLRVVLTPPGAGAAKVIPEVVGRLAADGRKVWVIGLDGADWQLLDVLIAEGLMPELGRLVAEGSSGLLLSEAPPLSPLLWTTMVTGVSPLEHGILDFSRFRLSDGTKEPISAAERQVPALWNMASWAGLPVVQLGLWATYPAEPVRGLSVSDRFFAFLFTEDTPPAGAVFPANKDAWAREKLAAAEREVDFARLAAYFPWLDQAEFARLTGTKNPYDNPVGALGRILVETGVYDRLFRAAVEEIDPAFALLYIQGTDTVGHTFAPFAPPQRAQVSAQDFSRYSQVHRRYFAEVDKLLGDYRELAAAHGATLMLVSDHGFLWGEGRPTDLSSFAFATAAKWHRNEGMYLLWGKDIAPSRSRSTEGAPGLRRVAATTLALLGLPNGVGMEAGLLPGVAARAAEPLDYRVHYTPIGGVEGNTAQVGEEELAELRALGYVGSGEATARPEGAEKSALTAGWYNNRALILRDMGRREEARVAFEKAIELDPNLASSLLNLSDVLHAERELDRADELLVRALAHGLPKGPEFVIGRAIGYQRAGDPARSLRLVEDAVGADPDSPDLWLFLGRYRTERGDCGGATDAFETALRLDPTQAAGWASLGVARLCLEDRAGAAAALRRSLEIDPNQPKIRAMLAGPPGSGVPQR